MRRARALVLVAALVVLALAPAMAHVGPSPNANNRYLTVVAEPGAIRVVYTLFFGERPGAAARARMDREGDGVLSSEERRVFGEEIGAQLAAGLEIELDGEPVDIEWRRVDVGLDRAAVEGGAFSIDLEVLLCFEPRGEHTLRVVDGFRMPPVGEGALTLEASRRIEVLVSAMGDGEGRRRAFKWMGRGPIADEGYALEIRVPEGADVPRECAPEERGASERADEGAAAASAPAEARGSDEPSAPEAAEDSSRGGWAAFWLALLVLGSLFVARALRR